MKKLFDPVAVALIVQLIIVLVTMACAVPADTSSPALTTQPEATEVIESTPTVTDAVVEETQPTVNNPVNDVNNSVEATEPSYTEEELEILAIIVYQEAGGDAYSDDTRRKVGSVFLNRVKSPHFPNTFEAVATARKQYGTLYLTGIRWPDRASYDGEAHAVKRAYGIAEELLTNGSTLPDNVVWQAEFLQGDGLYSYQDGIYFCYTEVKE